MTQFQVIKIVGKLHEEITKWHSQKFEGNSPVTPLKKLEGLNESTQHTRVIRLHRALLLHSGDQHVSLSGKKNDNYAPTTNLLCSTQLRWNFS
jgi:hypothetical protein